MVVFIILCSIIVAYTFYSHAIDLKLIELKRDSSKLNKYSVNHLWPLIYDL